MTNSRIRTSGLKTADGAIKAAPGYFYGMTVNSDAGGVNDATAIIYDNASAASGTVVAKIVCGATETSTSSLTFTTPVWCEAGLYIDLTGTGAEAVVYYQ